MGTTTNAIIAYGLPFEPEETDNKAVSAAFSLEDGGLEKLEAYAKEHDLDVVWHCSSEYAMYIIGHEAVVARRGNPEALDFEKLSHAEIEYSKVNDDIEMLCKKFNLPFDKTKLKWWLCSYWG